MAARKFHLATGVIIYVLFSALFYHWFLGVPIYLPAGLFGFANIPWFPISIPRSLTSADIIYLVVALLLVLTGAEIADYDKAIAWMQHRDWFTHSCIIPGVLAIIVMVFTVVRVGNPLQILILNPTVDITLLLGITVFALGAASHLFLDYFPPIKSEELHSKKGSITAGHEAADYFISGMTAQELFRRLEGTALVHFWWNIQIEKEGKKTRRAKGYEFRKTLPAKQSQTYYLINGVILLIIAITSLLMFLILQFSTTWQQFVTLLLLVI
ncbi:MAG: hypothetical protein QXO71_07610 [Candidatus Jordarchaeaceae archaeon]